MRAYLQPNFGFPSDPVPVAYVIVILSNSERFKVFEKDGELYVNPIGSNPEGEVVLNGAIETR